MRTALAIPPDGRRAAATADSSEREAELCDFLENAAVPLHRVGEDGTILWANLAELSFLGYSAEEYIGHKIAEFHVDPPVVADILERLKRDETLTGYEARLRAKDGSIRYVAINSSVYRKAGKFAHTRCVTLDITSRKTVAELNQRMGDIIESSDDAIIGKDLNGIIQSWNAGAERIFGYTAEEVIGKHISIIAAPDRIDDSTAILARISKGERVDHFETKRKTKDGKIITVSLTVSPIRNASGVVNGASKVLRDTTQQRLAAELTERLAAIVESSDDAIIAKDLSGYIQSWNRGAERLFGYTAEEAIGKHISMLAAPERENEIPDILERLKRGERVNHYQTKRKTKDGRILTVSLTVSPIRDTHGNIIGASKVARDITLVERQEQALREANAALLASNADLQQFAYSASHDLQEPLRMVSTYSELLMRNFGDKLGPDGGECLGYTRQGALRMEQLLKDLRAYTLVSTSEKKAVDPIDSDAVLDKSLQSLGAAIIESGASITRTSLPKVKLHEFQLEQLLQNLIGNAIRYRSSAPPEIAISATPQGTGWLFAVRDNGIGIGPEYKEQVFDIFKRLHSVDEYPGTGMGLAICKRIVERAGGRIWVDSEPGRGSTFYFTIP
jgi:PAS domain S-box-containing protein